MDIRHKTRKHIADLLAEDLDGHGESIMKEIWEEANEADENDGDETNFKAANDELRRIIAWLRAQMMIPNAAAEPPA